MRLFNLGICIFLGLAILGSPLIRPKLFNSEEIPSLEVQVVNAETGESMEGVLVYYRLRSAYLKHFLGIPKIDPIHYRELIQEKKYSNKDGIVYIEDRKVSLKLYENILREVILVNGSAPWTDVKENELLKDYNSVSVASESGKLLYEETIVKTFDDYYYKYFTVIDEINDNGEMVKRKIIVKLNKKE